MENKPKYYECNRCGSLLSEQRVHALQQRDQIIQQIEANRILLAAMFAAMVVVFGLLFGALA